jgi:hypothetical protein
METSVAAERVIEAIEDLLRIAEVAMPTELFEIDPRILEAQEIVALLKGDMQ